MRKEIMRVDEVNRNGRSYSKAMVEEALKNWPKHGMPGTIGLSGESEISLGKIALIARNPAIEGNKLMADIELMPAAKAVMKSLEKLEGKHVYVTSGVGQINEDGQVYDYKITSIGIVPRYESAWEPVND